MNFAGKKFLIPQDHQYYRLLAKCINHFGGVVVNHIAEDVVPLVDEDFFTDDNINASYLLQKAVSIKWLLDCAISDFHHQIDDYNIKKTGIARFDALIYSKVYEEWHREGNRFYLAGRDLYVKIIARNKELMHLHRLGHLAYAERAQKKVLITIKYRDNDLVFRCFQSQPLASLLDAYTDMVREYEEKKFAEFAFLYEEKAIDGNVTPLTLCPHLDSFELVAVEAEPFGRQIIDQRILVRFLVARRNADESVVCCLLKETKEPFALLFKQFMFRYGLTGMTGYFSFADGTIISMRFSPFDYNVKNQCAIYFFAGSTDRIAAEHFMFNDATVSETLIKDPASESSNTQLSPVSRTPMRKEISVQPTATKNPTNLQCSRGQQIYGDPDDDDDYVSDHDMPLCDEQNSAADSSVACHVRDPQQLIEMIEKLCEEITDEEGVDPPPRMKVEFYQHQRIGVGWMLKMERSDIKGGILADDMGLGKTIQTIGLIYSNLPVSTADALLSTRTVSSVTGLRRSKRLGKAIQRQPLDQASDCDFCESDDSDYIDNESTAIVDQPARSESTVAGTLIVLPLSVIGQWKEQLEKFVKPPPTVLMYHRGSLNQNRWQELADNPSLLCGYEVVLTTFPTLLLGYSNRKSALHQIEWHRCVLDEAHTIKNRETVGSIACAALKAKYRWCLTGTPIQNTADDIFSLFRFLQFQPYNNWDRFSNDISLTDVPVCDEDERGKRTKLLQTVLRCVMLRRRKNTNNKEVKCVEIEFSAEERALYNALQESSLAKLLSMDNQKLNYRTILTMMLRLRQMCLHPSLIVGNIEMDVFGIYKGNEGSGDGDDCNGGMDDFENEFASKWLWDTSLDTKAEVEIIINQTETGQRLCVLCSKHSAVRQFIAQCGRIYCWVCFEGEMKKKGEGHCTLCDNENCQLILMTMLKRHLKIGPDIKSIVAKINEKSESSKLLAMMDELESIKLNHPGDKTIIFCSFASMLTLCENSLKSRGFKYVRYNGAMRIRERDEACKRFKEKAEITIMLVSLKAGNVGLNLMAANHVILLDVWWNPAIENQAIDRVDRIGQEKKVFVTKITVVNTIEDRVVSLQVQKTKIINEALMEGKCETSVLKRLDREELLYLFGGRKSFGTN